MGGYRSSKDLAEEHFRLAKAIRSQDIGAIETELQQHLSNPARYLRKAGGTAFS